MINKLKGTLLKGFSIVNGSLLPKVALFGDISLSLTLARSLLLEEIQKHVLSSSLQPKRHSDETKQNVRPCSSLKETVQYPDVGCVWMWASSSLSLTVLGQLFYHSRNRKKKYPGADSMASHKSAHWNKATNRNRWHARSLFTLVMI